MPLRKPPIILPSSNQHATQKERMQNLETRMEGLIQWHQDLGDRVYVLEQEVGEVRKEITGIKEQVQRVDNVNAQNNLMLRELTACIVGVTTKGMERPGLCEDVKEMKEMVADNSTRLSSLERTRATVIAIWGIVSTALTALGFWIWSHTGQILTTITEVYGPKTEVKQPQKLDSK